ncbi:Transcription factor ILR3 [Cucurbita argyrosperma subsp. argyrosperma]|nr:Transcription factor ILR3 [Cucurbita argyrosperma subsp. argyrosperma]
MVSAENPNWLFDCSLIDDIPVPNANFPVTSSSFSWAVQPFNGFPDAGVEIDGSLADLDGRLESGSNKRFLELGSILDTGRLPKTDKAAILVDAVRMVNQLRSEARKLKESNSSLQEKIKELKASLHGFFLCISMEKPELMNDYTAEKNELHDGKQKLKADKEQLEQQVKSMPAQPGFLPPPPISTFASQGQAPGNKLVLFVGYHPGVAMWQFMPPAAVDTSQDHVLRPPVA